MRHISKQSIQLWRDPIMSILTLGETTATFLSHSATHWLHYCILTARNDSSGLVFERPPLFAGLKSMKRYSPPVLADYGSITDCTFATPAQGGDPGLPGGGPFACGPTAGLFDTGGKSQQVLECDKFGEYSHPGAQANGS